MNEVQMKEIKKAARVPAAEYVGRVVLDGVGEGPLAGWCDGGEFKSVSALLHACAKVGVSPSWAWGMKPHYLGIDAGTVLVSALVNFRDDAHIAPCAKRQLQALLDAWCARQDVMEGTETWEECGLVVIIDKEAFEEELREAEASAFAAN